MAEAVAALVATFADVTGCDATGTVEVLVGPGADEAMLVQVLDEVIYRLETTGELPVGTEVSPLCSGLRVRFRMTGADLVEPVGAVPKAASLHELRFTDDGGQWSCTVTVDV